MTKRGVGIVIFLLCLAGLSTAMGQSTLHIGPGAGTACATGCGGDPNLLPGARKVDIYQTASGAPTLTQPILLILGVPSQYEHFLPAMPVSGVRSINPYPAGSKVTGTVSFATGGTYGLINPVSDGFFGTMTAGEEVYSFLGLAGANNSNSFTNWAAEDDEYVSLTVTGFNIHVYAINLELGAHGLIDIALVQNVPKGTYIVAYGAANGQFYSVPFTEAGLKCSY